MWNKKGEKLLSMWWIFVLVVIGGAVVIGVLIYFNAEINIKEMEADVLGERIVRCLTRNGFLRQDFLDKEFDIFEECKLRGQAFTGGNFYINISVYGETGPLREEIRKGGASFEKNCRIEKMIEAKHYPRCSEKNENILYYEGEEIKRARLMVLAGSDQVVKKMEIVK